MSARQIGQPLPIYVPGDEYTLRKIADGRMAPARGEVRDALPDTPHSCPSRWQQSR